MEIGDTVQCRNGDIDNRKHAGENGKITGFARFSVYHQREAMVKFADGTSAWFWLNDLELTDACLV